MRVKKKRLTFLVFLNAISLGAIALIMTSVLWANSIYKQYEKESIRIEQEHIEAARVQLKNRVDSFVKLLRYRNSSLEDNLKSDLKNRVYELNRLMLELYNKNKQRLTDAQLQALIRNTVRGLRYNKGQGYYFINTVEGDVILSPVSPKYEGLNLYDFQDDVKNFVVREEIEIVQNHGQGFTEGYWKKPSVEQGVFRKITYVQKFIHFDWYMGTSGYVDEVVRQVQNEFLQYATQLRYGDDNEQYIFIHDKGGVQLANGVYSDLVGENLYDLTDANGVKITQRQLSVAFEPPFNGFVSHLWPKHNSDGTTSYFDSFTYVVGVPEWDWVVGSNIDMTQLQIAIEEHKKELGERLQSSITHIVILMLGLLIVGFLAAVYTSKRIRKGISFFAKHIQQSSDNMNVIDHKDVQYREFEGLVTVFNYKTSQINRLLHQDGLTGLYNRRFLDSKLKELLEETAQDQKTLSIVMFDIDYFKAVNDEFGHLIGDCALCEVARCIQSLVRQHDLVGRFGGEEILVILPNTSCKEAYQMAERCRLAVESLSIKGIHYPITVSGGISSSSGALPEDMITEADNKLYQAKENGRNRIVS